jgi:3-hydroxyisobutyrate dehydrogenase-like beta-hydroxyacid dehydrogenase
MKQPVEIIGNVGIVGLGLVGMALARRLISMGHLVHGFDIDVGKAPQARASNVVWVASLQALAQNCQIVIVAVLNDAALLACAQTISQHAKQTHGCAELVISCVTASQSATVQAAQQIQASDLAFVDLPLLGSSQQIEQGQAMGLLGAGAATLERWQPLLSAVAPNLKHVGDVGLGVAAKLACNLVLGLNRSALAEGMALAQGFGIAPTTFLSLLEGSAAYSKAVDVAGPRMAQRDFAPVSKILQHRKDVALILDAAQQLGMKNFLASAQAALLDEAIEQGFGLLDNVAVVAVYDRS